MSLQKHRWKVAEQALRVKWRGPGTLLKGTFVTKHPMNSDNYLFSRLIAHIHATGSVHSPGEPILKSKIPVEISLPFCVENQFFSYFPAGV